MADPIVPLNDNPDHSGLTDEEMETFLASRFGDPAAADADGGSDDASGDEAPGAGATVTAPSSDTTTPIDTDDVWEIEVGTAEAPQTVKLTKEQARSYVEFEQFLAANPDLAEAIGGSITGTHKFLPVETPAPQASPNVQDNSGQPAALTPPDALDLDDPVQRAVWERLVATNTQLADATARIERHESQLQQQQTQTTEALVGKSTQLWRESNTDITDADMEEIKQVAARLGVVPSLMSPVDPITGLPRQVDPIKALEDAYDLARWQIPRLREVQLATFQQQARETTTRKKKLSSLGGSSGSVPRQPETVPTNPTERRQAMIREMADVLNGNWIQPEDK